ncbi:T6SS immunity protein Tli4 family protein [Photorhabdus tasmaniensis]|uniref:T6SS immunity protein Tli4 family protein n=1 Tax=Photorhabdus tasmaniensis TaxID=1004159 RepID=UPI0010CE0500|nr:T6SS immunity protein Tli4 family protein [Photorhabdus tasmaniensis]
MNKKNIFLILLFVLAIYALWRWYFPDPYHPSLTEKEKQVTTEMLANRQTRCVGRYLIDIPAAFGNVIHNGIFIGDAKIETERLYPPEFAYRIEAREQELKTMQYVKPKDMPFLKRVYRLQDNMEGVIFDRNESSGVPGYARVLEAHLYSHGVAFTVTMEFIELSDDKYKADRDDYIKGGFSEREYNELYQTLEKMKGLLSRISGRKDTEIPTVAGTCIPDGFIAGNWNEKENMGFVYRGNQGENFKFSIEILNDLTGENTLLERIGEIEKDLNANRGGIARKGKKEVNGIHGEELLAIGLQPFDNNPRYQFELVANETAGDYKNPYVDIMLRNYQLPPTPYTGDELITFWDTVISTFRKRPGAF